MRVNEALYYVSGWGTVLCQSMGHCIMLVDGALYYVSQWGIVLYQ